MRSKNPPVRLLRGGADPPGCRLEVQGAPTNRERPMISHRNPFCTCPKCILNRYIDQGDVSHLSSLFRVPVFWAKTRLDVKYHIWPYLEPTRSNLLVGIPVSEFRNGSPLPLRFQLCTSSFDRHRVVPFALVDGGPIFISRVDPDVTELSRDPTRGVVTVVEPLRGLLKVGAGFPIPTNPILIGRRSRHHRDKGQLITHP